jgi:predicted 3-demethylubiquinone-9 3-methyltransferase (glyoxalase superfamily)
MATMHRITPNLWFDKQAEEAANFYVSVFKNSTIGRTSRYSEEGFEVHKMPAGTVMTIEFTLDGQNFVALNGGPVFKFTEAVSFIINCESQEEVDHYWNKLSEGGDPKSQMCGWLKDKFGLSWQVVPSVLSKMMTDPDKAKAKRAMHAMLQMKKIDIPALEKAFNGE